MMFIKRIYMILWLSPVLFIASPAGIFGTGTEKFLFSLDAENEKISQVIEKISKTSGYRIVFSGEEDIPISLQLKDMSLEEILRRVLRDMNYTAIWDNAEKKILLSVYGLKGKARGGPDFEIQTGTVVLPKNPRNVSSQPQIEFWKNTIFQQIKPEWHELSKNPIIDYMDDYETRAEEPEVSVSGSDTPFVQGTDTLNED